MTSHKLKPVHKEFIYRQISSGVKSNREILEKLSKEYGVRVSSAMVSRLRQTKNIYNSNFFTMSMQAKMKKKKSKIDADMLDVASEIVTQAKRWFREHKDDIKDFTPKEISMVMGQFHKFLKTYQDMVGAPDTRTTTLASVQEWDKRFEEMK